eukprot:7362570-Pyramimonas_sp.AAC.1
MVDVAGGCHVCRCTDAARAESEEQDPSLARGTAVLVPRLPRAGHTGLCEELPTGAPDIRPSGSAVWQGVFKPGESHTTLYRGSH